MKEERMKQKDKRVVESARDFCEKVKEKWRQRGYSEEEIEKLEEHFL